MSSLQPYPDTQRTSCHRFYPAMRCRTTSVTAAASPTTALRVSATLLASHTPSNSPHTTPLPHPLPHYFIHHPAAIPKNNPLTLFTAIRRPRAAPRKVRRPRPSSIRFPLQPIRRTRTRNRRRNQDLLPNQLWSQVSAYEKGRC